MAASDRPRTSGRLVLLGLAAGITVTIVAWGVLVLAAIDFGRDARGGSANGWLFLGAASLGAVACLFLAIIFASKLQARVRSSGAGPTSVTPPAAPVEPAEAPLRPGDVVELDDEGLPPPSGTTQAHEPAPEPTPEPAPTYHSKHSRPSVEPAADDAEDSPAAAYRGKRAAR